MKKTTRTIKTKRKLLKEMELKKKSANYLSRAKKIVDVI